MKKQAAIWFLSFLAVKACGADIYTLIQSGQLQQASDSLSLMSTASRRDGNSLFFGSLLEANAEKSARLMQAALDAAVDPIYQEEIYYRLAQYYFIRRDLSKLAQLALEYRTRWEHGKHQCEMQRLAVAAEPETAGYESTVHEVDRYLAGCSQGERRQWGLIDKARVMLAFGKRAGADEALKSLSRERSGPGVPQALYLLGMEAVKGRKADEATLYYGLLRDAYPCAVGLDALMDDISAMSADDTRDIAAEKATGTYYAIQVGVFAGKENARKQADAFKRYGKPVDITTKEIGGVVYRAVFVGHFESYAEADTFKKTLEASLGEVFQVVAR